MPEVIRCLSPQLKAMIIGEVEASDLGERIKEDVQKYMGGVPSCEGKLMVDFGVEREGKKKRKLSKWQQCIRERRSGKPFDPSAIRELSKEYKAGRCP
jgi:hypothetical protein